MATYQLLRIMIVSSLLGTEVCCQSALFWSENGTTKQTRSDCGYPYPEHCYNWNSLPVDNNALSCDLDSIQQTSLNAILDPCRGWFRAYSLYPYKFQILPNDIMGFDSGEKIYSQFAQSKCYVKAAPSSVYPDRKSATMRSAVFRPNGCVKLQTTFWYRLSAAPILTGDRDKDYFLELVVHHSADNTTGFIPNWQIWGSTRDYAAYPGPNVWTRVQTEYAADAQFSLNFNAHHGDTCNTTTIELDGIDTKIAVPLNECITPNTDQTTTAPATNNITTTNAVTFTEAQHITPTSTVSNVPNELSSASTASAGAATTMSPLSMELQKAADKNAYPDNITYYTQSTHNVLDVIQSAVGNNSVQLNFNDILNTANFFQAFTGEDVPSDLPEGAEKDAVDTLLQITGQIVSAEETGKLEAPATSSDGYDAAATIYQALEDMYNSLPPKEEPYVFNNSFSVAYVQAVLINGSSQFEHLNLSTQMEVKGFSRETGITALADDNSKSLASIAFKTEALQEAFDELKQTTNGTPAKFVFSLSAMPSFKFAKFIPTNEMNERSSPIVLLASLGQNITKKDIITIRHNVDVLFDHPSGARRQHQCIFLNYTSKHWSGDGCRMTAKHVEWDNTIVECTCDHLTPFSLLLTLCGSLSRSFIPKDKPLTLDLAVVTTATTLVATVCCLLALAIITVKVWHGLVDFDEVNFTRMGLWIALFGMYLFTVFSQLMVYAPKLCGQQFCFASGIILHWFTLMSVGWTVVQTVDVMRIILNPMIHRIKTQRSENERHKFRIKMWVAATFIPGLFPLLASLPHFFEDETTNNSLGGYGYGDHEKWCWLNAEQTWIPWVTFIAPLSAAGVLNIATVIVYIRDQRAKKKLQKKLSISEDRNKESNDLVKHRVQRVIINTGLMGMIWLSAWLALFSCFIVDPTWNYVFVLLLTGACGSQAVYIIIFQGIIGDKRSKKR